MIPSAVDVRKLTGREVLALAIGRLRDRAEYGRSVAEAYGEACDRAVLVDAELWDALANSLQVIASRGAVKLEDRASKDGSPTFASKLRHEVDQEVAQIFAGALRGALTAGIEPEAVKNAA